MAEILQLDPTALIILFVAGGGIIYVVRLFTQAQTIREREMWAAIQSIMTRTEKMSQLWLSAIETQGTKSSDAINNLANETAALKNQVAALTASINESIETGATLQGATSLMSKILRDGRDGRRSFEHEEK